MAHETVPTLPSIEVVAASLWRLREQAFVSATTSELSACAAGVLLSLSSLPPNNQPSPLLSTVHLLADSILDLCDVEGDPSSSSAPPKNIQKYVSAHHVQDITNQSPDRRERPNHPAWKKSILLEWFHNHRATPAGAFPTDEEKRDLCQRTNLTLSQLNNWFINAVVGVSVNLQRHSSLTFFLHILEPPLLNICLSAWQPVAVTERDSTACHNK
ncbi:hypothetical protein BDK51DRAFT_27009 [Blyttiomyces helicus]|uniref:Homeobox domain-containing protein n=1 Tax=Blyttiomyces helicus TaxID=388810 RepID=A0A4P9W613_9FUNG|nr:hypothetical protein BDK51DRAFT_27009 [Blyttiomyces helicus]|eukprot:RKO87881.1 hypothetical protein BDK51DRAFT_27009 [Blyttiomyces helicus]